MNILMASASPEDARTFPAALAGHRVETVEGLPTEKYGEVEALAVVHRQPAVKEALHAMPCLRLIVTRSTGYEHIDLTEAKRRNIAVCNVPEYCSASVAEFTFGLVLCLARCIPQAVAASRGGAFSVEGLMGVDLAGKTLGIVGLGKIGRNLARMAKGFEMKVVVHDPDEEGSMPIEALLTAADVVALCCPLTPVTHHLIDARSLALMKPTAFLVNTARGGVVDSRALLEALDAGRLAGAALDVLESEEALRDWTPDANMERNLALMNHPNVLVTPTSPTTIRRPWSESGRRRSRSYAPSPRVGPSTPSRPSPSASCEPLTGFR